MVLRCELCRIEVPDEHVLADHTSGKRHQALVAAQERFEHAQISSIYVSRIKPEHNEEMLQVYFARFGEIKNCFIDKDKHIFAIVEYADANSAQKCLEYSAEHKLSDGSRLKVKQRAHHEFKPKRMLMSEQEFLNVNKEKEIEHHAIIVQALNHAETIDEQTELLVQHETIHDDVQRERVEFVKELETMFRKHFSESKLCLTGSMANQLATNLSDLDLVLILNDTYLEVQHLSSSSNSSGDAMNVDENSCSNDVEMTNRKFKRNASDESTSRSLSPPLPPSSYSADDLLRMPVADRLNHIGRLLRSYAAHVCHVQRIAQARCPVVRFCHKTQKIFCELSINNHLAVANTDLIRLFLVLEPKLRPLLYAIRLWIKQRDLFGRGHRFNTYTLFWMIVCSLQSNTKHLPSVQSLANSATHERQHGPWNCSIPDISQINKNNSVISIEQMLHDFFTFYSKFDANQFALSPWTGKIELSNNTVPFSILDPFEHDHNLSSNVSRSNWMKFQDECSLALQILDEFSKKRHNKSWGLCLLLTRKPLPQSNFTHEQQPITTPSTVTTFEFDLHQSNEHELHVKLEHILTEILLFERVNNETSAMIRKKRPVSPSSATSESRNGGGSSTEVTPNTLAEQFDETLSAKRRRIDDDGNVSTAMMDSPKISYSKEKSYFQVSYRTWQDRRKLKRTVDSQDPTTTVFLREKAISEQLKQDKEHRLGTPLRVSMETIFLPTGEINQKVETRFELQTNGQNQIFIDLTHFLALFLPKMLQEQSVSEQL